MLPLVLNKGGIVSKDISTKFSVVKRYSTIFFNFKESS